MKFLTLQGQGKICEQENEEAARAAAAEENDDHLTITTNRVLEDKQRPAKQELEDYRYF